MHPKTLAPLAASSLRRGRPSRRPVLGGLLAALALIAIAAPRAAAGAVWAFGANGNGQLGDGSATNRSTLTSPSGLKNVRAVSGGSQHALAVKTDGTVWAWGLNGNGQVGNGSTTASRTPVQVVGPGATGFLTGVASASAGWYHNLARKADGTVWAWGLNGNGRLGDGTTAQSVAPVQVKGPGGTGWLTGVTSVSAGDAHSLAAKTDGSLWAWGYNNYGQLGVGAVLNTLTPMQVQGAGGSGYLTNVVAGVAGYMHSMALKSDGTVWAWGDNDYGQLGDGSTAPSGAPVQVQGLSDVTALCTGAYHNLALKSDGTVWAWGGNLYGGLGIGSTSDSPVPVQVKGPDGMGYLTHVKYVAAGNYHSLAVTDDGSVWVWGLNSSGQLGLGNTTPSSTPVQIPGVSGMDTLDAGGNFSLVVTALDLGFVAPPASPAAGLPLDADLAVGAYDASGAVFPTFCGNVTVAIKAGTGAAGATLSGTKTVTAVNGVAEFSDLTIDRPGSGYVLLAYSGVLPPAESAAFDVAQTPTQMAVSAAPASAVAGAAFSVQPSVTVRDAFGDVALNYAGPVTLSIKAGTGTPGAALGGSVTVNAVAGVATFAGLSIDKPGLDYVLAAESGALPAAQSPAFHVSLAGAETVGVTGPCASSDGAVYYGAGDGVLRGVRAADGAGLLSVDTRTLPGDANPQRKILGRPSRRPWGGADAVFCVTDDNRLVVAGTDGAIKLSRTLPGSGTAVAASVMVQDDVAYVATTNGENAILAKVDTDGTVSSQPLAGGSPSSVSVYGPSLFVGTTAGTYRVQAGELIVGLCFGGAASGSPFISTTANIAYTVSNDGKVSANDASTAAPITSFGSNGSVDLGITVASGDKVRANLFAYNDRLYIGGMDNKVYCLSAATGADASPAGGKVFYDAGPGGSIADAVGVSPFGHGCLVFGSTNGRFYQVSLTDPAVAQVVDLKSPIRSAPAVDRTTQTISIAAEDGHIYRLPAF